MASMTSGCVTIEVDRPLHRELKISAAQAGITMRELVASALWDRIRAKANAPAKSVLPAHSPARKKAGK